MCDLDRWVEYGRVCVVVDSVGNFFGNVRDYNSSSIGFGFLVMFIFVKMLVNFWIISEDYE